jgi:hypothetical protein
MIGNRGVNPAAARGNRGRHRRPGIGARGLSIATTMLAGLVLVVMGLVTSGGAQAQTGTTFVVTWNGQNGADLVTPDCSSGQEATWHWILTAPNVNIISGVLVVTYVGGVTTSTEGTFNGGTNGAMHFYVTLGQPGTVVAAVATVVATGDPGHLTISGNGCTDGQSSSSSTPPSSSSSVPSSSSSVPSSSSSVPSSSSSVPSSSSSTSEESSSSPVTGSTSESPESSAATSAFSAGVGMTGDVAPRSSTSTVLLASGMSLVGVSVLWLVLPGLRRRGAHS